MPSKTPTPSLESSHGGTYLQSLLNSTRPFLRGELESVDKNMPSLVAALRSVGAGECWHKHGTFLEHLVDIYRILKIWKAPASALRPLSLRLFQFLCRDVIRAHVGEAVERLIYLFCIVPRQPLIHDDLLFYFTDVNLVEHLKQSEMSLQQLQNQSEAASPNFSWRNKVQSLVPANGVTVRHIKTGEDVLVSRRVVAVFVLMTMADFSDQLFGFQDELFDNKDGRLEFRGNNYGALWPRDGMPGLWMNSISRMAAIYNLIVREEEMFIQEKKTISTATATAGSGGGENAGVDKCRDEDIELVVPPVFDKCTRVLDAEEHLAARELNWEAVCDVSQKQGKKGEEDRAEELLLRCVEMNPFIGEPHVVLGQVYLTEARFEEAEREAERGLTRMLEWRSAWDKRMTWEGWIAWARVLLMKAKDRSWPQTSWGILNLGLVR
ncbi:unnamed protein product [Malus baccata var. baccata]